MITFEECITMLQRGRKGTKKLENNTRLIQINDATFGIQLHETVVVSIHFDGTYTLYDGGYRTVTTKDRINHYSPARICTKNGVWILGSGHIYTNGVCIKSDGTPTTECENYADTMKAKRLLDRTVSKYIEGFAADAINEGGLRQPTNGDCWGCLFKAEGNQQPMGFDHILGHFTEKYYVPSLLVKAITARGYTNPGFIWAMIDSEIKNGKADMLKNILQSYFRKIKPNLMKETPNAHN